MLPMDRRAAKNKIGRGGRVSEKRVAKDLGARETAASGAVEGFKGDMSLADFLIEAKSTSKDSMSLKFEWLVKIANEAMAGKKKPAVAISFTTEGGRAIPRGDWVMVPMHVWQELVEE